MALPTTPERQLDAVGEPSLGVHRRDVDAELDDGARHLRGDPGEDGARADELHRRGGLEQVIGDLGVDHRHAGDVEDEDRACSSTTRAARSP